MSQTPIDGPPQPTNTHGLSYRLAVEAASPAPLVVLVPELTGNQRWWDHLLITLAATDHVPAQIATYDLRGRGDALGRETAHSLDDQISDLDAVIAANTRDAPRRVLVIGHGFGARVAAAASASGGIDAVVALDGPRPPGDGDSPTRAMMVDETAGRLDVTFPHRNAYLTYWQSQPWFGAAGIPRAARDGLTGDLGGTGFGWRPRINRLAVSADVAQWTRATPTIPAPVARRSVLIVAEGPPDDEIAQRVLEDVGIEHRRRVAAHHLGLLFQEQPVAEVVGIISEVLEQVAHETNL